MDGFQFDQLAKRLVTRADRRRVLQGVSGFVVAILGMMAEEEPEVEARRRRRRRRRSGAGGGAGGGSSSSSSSAAGGGGGGGGGGGSSSSSSGGGSGANNNNNNNNNLLDGGGDGTGTGGGGTGTGGGGTTTTTPTIPVNPCLGQPDGTPCSGGLCCGEQCQAVACCATNDCGSGELCATNGTCAVTCTPGSSCGSTGSGCECLNNFGGLGLSQNVCVNTADCTCVADCAQCPSGRLCDEFTGSNPCVAPQHACCTPCGGT